MKTRKGHPPQDGSILIAPMSQWWRQTASACLLNLPQKVPILRMEQQFFAVGPPSHEYREAEPLIPWE